MSRSAECPNHSLGVKSAKNYQKRPLKSLIYPLLCNFYKAPPHLLHRLIEKCLGFPMPFSDLEYHSYWCRYDSSKFERNRQKRTRGGIRGTRVSRHALSTCASIGGTRVPYRNPVTRVSLTCPQTARFIPRVPPNRAVSLLHPLLGLRSPHAS